MAAQKWRTEDWVAVYLGFLIIIVTLAAFSGGFINLKNVNSTFRWTTDGQLAARTAKWNATLDAVAKDAAGKDAGAVANQVKAALQSGDRKAIEKAAGVVVGGAKGASGHAAK